MSRLALKKLTASDLTLFEWHFRNRNVGNQKAINLNADVFVDQLFPGLPEAAAVFDGRLPVDLFLYGPGAAAELNLQRKIIKGGTYKNWRLDGETIHNPGDTPDRFNSLTEGDVAVMEFNEGQFPSRLRLVLLAHAASPDVPFLAHLDRRLQGRSMVSMGRSDLSSDVSAAGVAPEHPIHELLMEAALEDAAQGGATGARELRTRRSGRKIFRSELLNAKRRAEENGQLGEEFVNHMLQGRLDRGEITGFTWESADNAIAPYDFRVTGAQGETYVDVKATEGEFSRTIHVSLAELGEMAQRPSYEIYRVYGMNNSVANVRIASDLRRFASTVLGTFERLEAGVAADGVSVRPEILKFGPPTALRLLPA
jgi:Domain of unknown function (DUF3883)